MDILAEKRSWATGIVGRKLPAVKSRSARYGATSQAIKDRDRGRALHPRFHSGILIPGTEADIVMVAMGANIVGIKQPGTTISSCADWFRPVLFKVERMDND